MSVFTLDYIQSLIVILIIYLTFLCFFKNVISLKIFNFIFFYHLAFILIFFVFSQNNDSDSISYYVLASNDLTNEKFFYFGSKFIISITRFFINTFNLNFLSLNIIFGNFTTLGLLLMSDIIQKQHIKNKMFLFLLVIIILLPSLHFFSSSIGKEPLIFLSCCIIVRSLLKLKSQNIFLLILGCILLMFTRLYMAIPTIFILLLFFPLIYKEKIESFFIRIYYLFLLISILIFFSFITEIFIKAGIIAEVDSFNGKLDINYLWSRINNQFLVTSAAESNYADIHDNYLNYYFKYVFGPFIYQSGTGLKFIITKSESIIILLIYLIIIFFIGLNYQNKRLLINNLMFIAIFFSITIPLSFAISSYGIVIRQRIILYPFIIYILALNYNYYFNEKKINFNSNKSNNN